jgi:hypothetical protein
VCVCVCVWVCVCVLVGGCWDVCMCIGGLVVGGCWGVWGVGCDRLGGKKAQLPHARHHSPPPLCSRRRRPPPSPPLPPPLPPPSYITSTHSYTHANNYKVTGLDLSPHFLAVARLREEEKPMGIKYMHAKVMFFCVFWWDVGMCQCMHVCVCLGLLGCSDVCV